MSSPFSPFFYTIKHVLLTFDAFVKLNFAAYLITLHFGGKQGVRTAPASSIFIPLSDPFFLGFLLLALLHQRLLTLKRLFFYGTRICRLCV